MPETPEDNSDRLLFIVLAAVIGSFLAAMMVTERTSAEVDSLSDDILSSSTPSIERLAAVRGSTLEVELALSAYVSQASPRDGAAASALEGALERLKDDVEGYLSLPISPGQERHPAALQQAWVRFERTVARTRDLADQGAVHEASAQVGPARDRLVAAAMEAIAFNAAKGRLLAERIKETRGHTVRLARTLAIICVLLGAAGAGLIHRQTRSRQALALAHARSLEARAQELEQFAGRVAHDIRNPLAAAALAAERIVRRTADDGAAELARRITRGLARADSITTGLLEFARAGARPDPGARTRAAEVLADLAGPLAREAEEAHIALTIAAVPPVLVACSTGVYLSLVSNLVRNAIKYMGSSTTRRIEVSVTEEAGTVRTEVVDTGPGIPADIVPALFEPYFRAGGTGQDGLGLGLATVKKLAEGHGGRAGVRSTPGQGSTFWFELPGARRAETGSAEETPAPTRPPPELVH